MQGANRLLVRPEVPIPLRVPLIGTPVHVRTTLADTDRHTSVSSSVEGDAFTFGATRRAPLGQLVSWLSSGWEYDQTLGALLAEEDFLRSGRIPARTITALCGNIGSNLRAWRPGGFQWDHDDITNPMRLAMNELARRAKESKLSVEEAKRRTDLSKCLLAFRIQSALEGTQQSGTFSGPRWSTSGPGRGLCQRRLRFPE